MPFTADSVFKNMKEKAYFLKPTFWKPSDFSKMFGAGISATRIQSGVTEAALVPQSADVAGILSPPLTGVTTVDHLSQPSGPQFPSL